MPSNLKNRIDYSARGFNETRQELINYIRKFYPDSIREFDDATIGSVLIDLNAAICSNLSYHTDRIFQETQIDFAKERRSVFQIAKNLGLNVPNTIPSITVIDYTITVPVRGDNPDDRYFPIIGTGTQLQGGSQVFENIFPIDFRSPFSNYGSPNRTIIPLVNQNNVIQSYEIVKREVVFNGRTKILQFFIDDTKPFYRISLPDLDVISIESIIIKNGRVNTIPSNNEFFDDDIRYYEVDSLAEREIFTDNEDIERENGISAGIYKEVNKKFIKEFDSTGFCTITFGGGNGQIETIQDNLTQSGVSSKYADLLVNTALGEFPPSNSTVFIKYRVGGGVSSNLGPNTINTLLTRNTIVLNGPDFNINNSVLNSLRVTNPIPALGGANSLSIDQVRFLAKYNFSSQKRCVTLDDYKSRILLIDGNYGRPFRVNVFKENNKIVYAILSQNVDGSLNNTTSDIIKRNMSEYISKYRMVNDYVEIRDGRVYNLGVEVTIYIDENFGRNQIVNDTILTIIDYFDIQTLQMNEDIYLGELIENINNVGGVINVIDVKFFNKTGGEYSDDVIEMAFVNNDSQEIQLVENTLLSSIDSMFEIKIPQRDIVVNIKSRRDNRLA